LEDTGIDESIILKWILTFSVMTFSMPGFCCGLSNIQWKYSFCVSVFLFGQSGCTCSGMSSSCVKA